MRLLKDALGSTSLNHYCADGIHSERLLRYVRYREASAVQASAFPDIYIALNVHDNDAILSDMVLQLESLIRFLGAHRVFVSVFESGSHDQTRLHLQLLRYLLQDLSVEHSIEYGASTLSGADHRIDYLAAVRNKALSALWHHTDQGHHYERILFLNDVFYCAYDALELLYQSHLNEADLACGLDFDYDDRGLGFYDTWVARDVEGEPFSKRPLSQLTTHLGSNGRLRSGIPFQVACCWYVSTVAHELLSSNFLPPRKERNGGNQGRTVPTEPASRFPPRDFCANGPGG